jgi:hypothetical protein
MDKDALFRLQRAWGNPERKDECVVRMNDFERDYWMGTEFGQLGGYGLMMCCLLVLESVTSTPQWIRQPRPRVYLKEGTYHTRLFRGPSTNDMKK